MPLVVEVLCGRHFFVEQPCCFTKFTYGGQEYSTDADNGATSPQWQKTKFQLPYAGKAVEINFLVMNRKGRGESMQIASVMVQWASFLPGLRKVEDSCTPNSRQIVAFAKIVPFRHDLNM